MRRMSPRPAVTAGIACLVAIGATGVSAQPAVVLAPHIEPDLAEPERSAILHAFDQALIAEGVQPRPVQAGACPSGNCDASAVAAFETDAVQLTVWRSDSGGISGVSVAVVRSGMRYSEGASVEAGRDDGVANAVLEATRGAYQRARRGPGPWLEVTGRPAGSAVVVDGQPMGAVPGRYRVAGGLHRVVVRAEGFEPYDATVTVPRNPDGLRRIELELRRDDVAQTETVVTQQLAETRPSPLNFAIAGVAVVLGAVLAIGPLRTAADDGQCGREEFGRCTGIVEFDGGSAVQLGAATVLVLGGAAFALWAPLRVQAYNDGAEARLAARF